MYYNVDRSLFISNLKHRSLLVIFLYNSVLYSSTIHQSSIIPSDHSKIDRIIRIPLGRQTYLTLFFSYSSPYFSSTTSTSTPLHICTSNTISASQSIRYCCGISVIYIENLIDLKNITYNITKIHIFEKT